MNRVTKTIALTVAVIAMLVVMVATTSCIRIVGLTGSGNIVTEEREVSGFDKVSVSAGIELFIEQGSAESLKIESDDNIIKRVVTEVRNGRLEIKYKNPVLGGINLTRPVKVYLTVVDLTEIDISSGADIESKQIKTDKMEINISSGAVADINLDVGEFIASVSSGSDLNISGKAESQEVDLSSGCDYDARELESVDAILNVSSGSNAVVRVSGTLDVNVSSGANVRYIGTPEVTSTVSSGGNLSSIAE